MKQAMTVPRYTYCITAFRIEILGTPKAGSSSADVRMICPDSGVSVCVYAAVHGRSRRRCKNWQREPRESKHDRIVESLQEQCHLAEETVFRLEQVKDVGKGVDLQTKARVCQHDTGAKNQN